MKTKLSHLLPRFTRHAFWAASALLLSSASVAQAQTTYNSGSGTYTVPAGVTKVQIEAWGGGGGSGSFTGGTSGGTGGASTVNHVGLAPAVNLSAGGGVGSAAATNNTPTVGGAGGAASGGTVNTSGSTGGTGSIPSSEAHGGDGGASPNGGATQPGVTVNGTSANGVAGNPPGGGAAGGAKGDGGSPNRRSVGGGGGGGYTRITLDVSPGDQYNYSVGAGGTAGTGSGAAGANGRVIFTPVAAAALKFDSQPANTVYGSTINVVTVRVVDGSNATVTTDNSTQITLTASSGTLTGTTTQTVSSGVATFSDLKLSPVGTGYTLTASSSPTLTQDTSNAFNITPKPVTLTGTRVYDGTTNAAAAILSVSNAEIGDTVTVASGTATLASKNVGAQAIASMGTLALGGAQSGNYTLSGASGSVTITARALTIAAVTDTKVYDGTTASSATPSLTGLQSGDTVSPLTQVFQSKNVLGLNGSTLEVASYTVNDGNSGANYTVDATGMASGTITAAALTITADTDSKVYDGTVASSATPGVSGIIAPDTVTGLVQEYANKNVGTGKTLSVTAYTVNDGNSGNNYAVTLVDDTTGVITAAALTITADTDSKVYDGTVASSATPGVSGIIAPDTVTGLVQEYANKNVGTGKTLSVTAYTVNDGNSGNNYAVTLVDDTTGVITARPLTITAASDSKTYDGSALTNAGYSITGGSLAPFESLNSVVVTGSRTIAGVSPNVPGSAVILDLGANNVTLNYFITYLNGTLTVNPLPVELYGERPYDGTTDADFSILEVTNKVGLDDVVVAGGTGVLVDSDPGSQDFDNFGSLTLGGADAGNYTLAGASGSVVLITQANLTIVGAVAQNRAYDGTTDADVDFTSATLVGVVSGDDVTIVSSGYDAQFNTRHVGNSKPVTVTGVTLGGDDAYKYTLTQPLLTANITPQLLTLKAVSTNKPYGVTISYDGSFSSGVPASADFSLESGTIFNPGSVWDVTAVAITSTGFPAAAPFSGNPHPIVFGALSGPGASNYQVVTDPDNGTVTIVPSAFRSKATGPWNDPNTWEIEVPALSNTWVAAGATPNAEDADTVLVRSPHVVTVNAAVAVDQVTVQAGGQVTVSSVTLTVANGTDPVDLNVNGTVAVTGSGSITSTGAVAFNNGAVYDHARNNGSVVTATWNSGSTCLISGTTNAAPSSGLNGVNFWHFEWNTPGMTGTVTLSASSFTTNGNFSLVTTNGEELRYGGGGANAMLVKGNYTQTGGTFVLKEGNNISSLTVEGNMSLSGASSSLIVWGSNPNGSATVNVDGNFTISGGTLNLTRFANVAAVGVFNLKGDFTKSGGTIAETSNNAHGAFNFNGSSMQTLARTGGTISNDVRFTVQSGAYVQMDAAATVVDGAAASFTVASGGTLGIRSTAGIASAGATGHVQTGTRSFSTVANYIYNGSTAQITGTGLPAQVNNLTLDNATGLTTTNTVQVNGTLSLLQDGGLITTGANSVRVAAAGSIVGASNLRYINGKLARQYSATGSKAFPVGKGGEYRPLDFNYTAVDATSWVEAEAFASGFPGTLTPAQAVIASFGSRYWTLTQSGAGSFTYSATFLDTGATADTGAVERVLKYDSPTTVTLTPSQAGTSYTVSGLTTLSDFTIVQTADTGTTTVASADARTYGQTSTTLYATVTPDVDLGPVGGTLQFYIDNVPVGSPVTVTAGAASTTYNYAGTKPAGSYVVRAEYLGAFPYLPSDSDPGNNGTFTINKKALSIVPDNLSRPYGRNNPTFTYTLTGFENGETAVTAPVTGAPGLSTTATLSSEPGPYPINSTVGTLAAANYSFTPTAGTLTVGNPLAVDDGPYDAVENTLLTVPADGVLSNDSDDQSQANLTAELVSGPSNHDTFNLNADGSFTYKGGLNYSGPDSFTYKAKTPGLAESNTVTVTINVQGLPEASTSTLAATDIRQARANLKGLVTPDGTTTVSFRYGTTADLSDGLQITLPATINSGTNVPQSLWVSNLRSSTLYYFQIVASNSVGTVYGNIQSFTTLPDQWTWKKGATTRNSTGSYGTKGVETATTNPAARQGPMSWQSGDHLYIFGGLGIGTAAPRCHNDLWRYNTVNNRWVWLKGESTRTLPGSAVYGSKGVPHVDNTPGPRHTGTTWVDAAGNLWLFGGFCPDTNGGRYNDLWMFNVTSGNWTWMGGKNYGDADGDYGALGVPAASNEPFGRQGASAWYDATSNSVYLFGGAGFDTNGSFDTLNDLWHLDLSNPDDGWTWIGGADTIVTPVSNWPDARRDSAAWIDSRGYLWLFAGLKTFAATLVSDYANDLWYYNPGTGDWTQVDPGNGAVHGSKGVPADANRPGARYAPGVAKSSDGNVYLFGGSIGANPFFNDLWRFDVLTERWTWISGSNLANQKGTYGTQNIGALANVPGARFSAQLLSTASDELYVFGGGGFDGAGASGRLNDLFKYDFAPPLDDYDGIIANWAVFFGEQGYSDTLGDDDDTDTVDDLNEALMGTDPGDDGDVVTASYVEVKDILDNVLKTYLKIDYVQPGLSYKVYRGAAIPANLVGTFTFGAYGDGYAEIAPSVLSPDLDPGDSFTVVVVE